MIQGSGRRGENGARYINGPTSGSNGTDGYIRIYYLISSTILGKLF